MQYYPYDSRNILYRSQIGAVAAGNHLLLRLLLHKDAHCRNAYLRYRRDDGGVSEIEMKAAHVLEDYRFYECEIALDEGLYWYSFRYTSDYGDFFVIKQNGSLGVFSKQEGAWWQQTVYNADYTTPDWLKGGIIYQIFPDRFNASSKAKNNVPDDRFICNDWSKQPEYRQNGEKCVLGNDYYGGDLAGITAKLDYLATLGVTCIYLNPIFEAHSNHRYNTADYMKIDPLLGTEKDLEELCKQAEKHGISVILDGVFSHTGDDSRYFNRKNRYPDNGAYNSPDSPYRNWYKFDASEKEGYKSWWGIATLPEIEEENEDYLQFITGENGVLRYWLRRGIRGWRLDVADELPDGFLDCLRTAVKTEMPEAFILGEVWEDASNKVSYGSRRRFLRGRQLDSVMNYPFAGAIIDFAREGNAERLNETVCTVLENYPKCSVDLLMNHIGTHDTARILTVLALGYPSTKDREVLSKIQLSNEDYLRGVRLLRIAAALQYTLPGVPSLYYGDEAGMHGYGDPFCRAAFPWGNEDKNLTEFYKKLGAVRRSNAAFKDGVYRPLETSGGIIVFERVSENNSVLVAINRTEERYEFSLPQKYRNAKLLFGNSLNTVNALDFTIISV